MVVSPGATENRQQRGNSRGLAIRQVKVGKPPGWQLRVRSRGGFYPKGMIYKLKNATIQKGLGPRLPACDSDSLFLVLFKESSRKITFGGSRLEALEGYEAY